MTPLIQELDVDSKSRPDFGKNTPTSLRAVLRALFFNTAYFIFSAAYSPIFMKKIKQSSDPDRLWRERWGNFSAEIQEKLTKQRTIWLHAVSVGEVMAIRQFVRQILEEDSEIHLVLTTVTPTGQKIAKEMETERITVLYFPFDYSFVCRRFFETIRPEAVLLAETEIWPNLLLEAERFGIPVGILNARLSEKSKSRYSFFAFIFGKLFRSLDFVLAQTEEDGARFKCLGVSPEKILVLGNMKFDQVSLEAQSPETRLALKKEWNFLETDLILIAGSTHPQEEDVVAAAFQQLQQEFSDLKLILAPRHIERSQEIAETLQKIGLHPVLATARTQNQKFDVLILNQLGVLKHLYHLADLVYVGGSLTQRGGQNPIEPASCRKAVVHGPHVFNFEKIYRELDQEGSALRIDNQAQLTETLRSLLRNPSDRLSRGERAFQKVRSLQGATRRHVDWVSSFLKKRLQERIQYGHDSKLFPPFSGRL